MYHDANVDAQTDDAQLLVTNFFDDELERAAAAEHDRALNTAFCTQWSILPFLGQNDAKRRAQSPFHVAFMLRAAVSGRPRRGGDRIGLEFGTLHFGR